MAGNNAVGPIAKSKACRLEMIHVVEDLHGLNGSGVRMHGVFGHRAGLRPRAPTGGSVTGQLR